MILFFLFFVGELFAHEELHTIEVNEHQVEERPLSHIDRPSVVKKEVISSSRVQHKGATSLARAVDLEPGVQTALACANCGSTRITLNGLRGENTTLLIDGIPAFSSISSFYGMEALPVAGVERIEITRGAGASLVAPEAIGGTVNLVTATGDHNQFSYQSRGGERQLFNQQLTASYGSYQRGTLIAAQTSQQGSFDEDGNGVAEAANSNTRSFFLKHHQHAGEKTMVSGRVGFSELEILGGHPDGRRVRDSDFTLADETSFQRGDVRRRFVGESKQIADWIRLKRLDGGGQLIHHLDSDTTVRASAALSLQEQLANYSHGYDYDARDQYRFFDLRGQRALGGDHLVTLGVDHRNEEMHSDSDVLYGTKNLARDSFNFETLGFYVQDEWFLSEATELNLVLRVDHMAVHWFDKRLATNRLDETAFAPRAHLKHAHNKSYTSRVSLGVGYRAPLSMFESQHGTYEEGFELGIDRLERAETLTYTLNREESTSSTALSGSVTQLHGMAFADESQNPMRFRSARRVFTLGTLNALQVWRLRRDWTLEASADWFILPDGYKRKLPIAAQETRARLVSDYHWGKNELVAFLNVTGPRRLAPYNYGRNYNVLEVDGVTFEESGRSQKDLHAPAFATVDLYFQRKLGSFTGILGATNLLDTTQTKLRESPLAWQQHGDHFHLDNRHIWGPLQGRTLYAGLRWDAL